MQTTTPCILQLYNYSCIDFAFRDTVISYMAQVYQVCTCQYCLSIVFCHDVRVQFDMIESPLLLSTFLLSACTKINQVLRRLFFQTIVISYPPPGVAIDHIKRNHIQYIVRGQHVEFCDQIIFITGHIHNRYFSKYF